MSRYTLDDSAGEDAAFVITINYDPLAESPARIFMVAGELLQILQKVDTLLTASVDEQIGSRFVIERIESGSLRMRIATLLKAVDDDALKSMDWKKAVGKYVVKAKYFLLKKLENCEIKSKADLDGLAHDIRILAEQTNVLRMPAYRMVQPLDLAGSIVGLGKSLEGLKTGESIEFYSGDGSARIEKDNMLSQDYVEELLTEKTIVNTVDRILTVKKPDFLGDSRWVFKFSGTLYEANVDDVEWLSRFRSGSIDIRPQDSLHVTVKESFRYGSGGVLISQKNTILYVRDIVRAKREMTLGLPYH
ncbi:hypothetical protein ACR4XJ_01350 [Nitratidesulfovibrio sp. D1]|uniref:hypothetical protein n=1 Tax=Nitratidesulfovibrio sp. D1 TaxID=3440151 RepID=UPI003EB7C851